MSDHAKKLRKLISKAQKTNTSLPSKISSEVDDICENIEAQKAVYTVLLTLGVHKLLNPSQDIRYFQKDMPNGFSARAIDTKYITPTLKELGLTSMGESGWLTRSLEQPYPYTKSYKGNIQNVQSQFLAIVDYFEKSPSRVEPILIKILEEAIKIKESHQIEIMPLENAEKISISQVMTALKKLLSDDYSARGTSKLPVIIFYSLYQVLLSEVARYKGKELAELASHTSPDSNAKASGDVEVLDGNQVFETLEIKFGIKINSHLINRAIEKIITHNPKRYYILSTETISADELDKVAAKIAEIKEAHGCQLIINGVYPTIKYYLRLLDTMEGFLQKLTDNIVKDNELKIKHKKNWERIVAELRDIT